MLLAGGMVGCGATQSLITDSLGSDQQRPLATSHKAIILLNWGGGTCDLYPREYFQPIDLAQFPTADGKTLADYADVLKSELRRRLELMLNSFDLLDVQVVSDTVSWGDVETTVHLTQGMSPEGVKEIGRAKYDPCNGHAGDDAVIFGRQILELGGAYSLEEWITLFTNVCAHETAHTFGFGHVMRDEQQEPTTGRSLFVELMLDRHTMSEMRRPQRMLADLANCDQPEPMVAETVASRSTSPSTILPTCGCGTH